MRHTSTFIILILMIAAKSAWADTTVKSFQILLSSGGYLTGSLDGIIGPKTISAYNNFAIENGFPQESSTVSAVFEKSDIEIVSADWNLYH